MMDWKLPEGYAMVLDIWRGGFAPGFDAEQEFRFLRYGETETSVYRMADMHPAFNIAGLYYTSLDATRPEA